MDLFIPLIDNGNGDGKMKFLFSMLSSFAGVDAHLSPYSDSLIPRARNRAAADFLESKCRHLLFLDADIIFGPQQIAFLQETEADILCGIYPKKDDHVSPCLVTLPDQGMVEVGGIVPIARGGTGFMRIHRNVFEKMKSPANVYHNHGRTEWDFFRVGVVNGEYLSEDWYFCDEWRRLGGKVMLDTRIQVRHEGSIVFPLEHAIEMQRENERNPWFQIHGWFDFEDLYRQFARLMPDGGTFVELGCWLGRSIAALAAFARQANKMLDLHAVDTFQGTAGDEAQALLLMKISDLRKAFEENMAKCEAKVTVHPTDTVSAAADFADGSIDILFIDADHSYDAVFADISAWYPKVKVGGIIAGHDFNYSSVARAARDQFGSDIQQAGSCFVHHVKASRASKELAA